MDGPVPVYRVYEKVMGRRAAPIEIEAPDDGAAADGAREMFAQSECEIWLGSRLVQVIIPL